MWLWGKLSGARSPEQPPAAAPAPRRRPAARSPVPPAAAPPSPFRKALAESWEGRTVGELRQTLEEVGWDEASLDLLLERVGPPLAPPPSAARQAEQQPRRAAAAAVKPDQAAATAKAAAAAKRRRQQEEEEEDDDDEEDAPPPQSPRKIMHATTPRSAPSPRSPDEKRVRKLDASLPAEVAALSPRQLRVRIFGPCKAARAHPVPSQLARAAAARA
jgi:hypothetical protein